MNIISLKKYELELPKGKEEGWVTLGRVHYLIEDHDGPPIVPAFSLSLACCCPESQEIFAIFLTMQLEQPSPKSKEKRRLGIQTF